MGGHCSDWNSKCMEISGSRWGPQSFGSFGQEFENELHNGQLCPSQ
jgi:hypothetical protein